MVEGLIQSDSPRSGFGFGDEALNSHRVYSGLAVLVALEDDALAVGRKRHSEIGDVLGAMFAQGQLAPGGAQEYEHVWRGLTAAGAHEYGSVTVGRELDELSGFTDQ